MLERTDVQKPQCRDVNLDAMPGQLALVQQVELIDTNMLGPKLVRGLVKVAREGGRVPYRYGWFEE